LTAHVQIQLHTGSNPASADANPKDGKEAKEAAKAEQAKIDLAKAELAKAAAELVTPVIDKTKKPPTGVPKTEVKSTTLFD